MSRTKRRNVEGNTPNRSIRVADKLWGQIDHAAKLAGVSRREFILTVCANAAHQIIQNTEQDKVEA